MIKLSIVVERQWNKSKEGWSTILMRDQSGTIQLYAEGWDQFIDDYEKQYNLIAEKLNEKIQKT